MKRKQEFSSHYVVDFLLRKSFKKPSADTVLSWNSDVITDKLTAASA